VVDAVGGPGGGDVALDVRELECALRWRHLQRLEHRRVDHADDERHEGPHTDGENGQHPALAPDVPQQDGSGGERDVEQERDGWQAGVDVGVARAGDDAVVGEVELVAARTYPAAFARAMSARMTEMCAFTEGRTRGVTRWARIPPFR